MDVNEVRALKKETERKIKGLIDIFNEQTGCIVSEISLAVDIRENVICVGGVSLTVKVI